MFHTIDLGFLSLSIVEISNPTKMVEVRGQGHRNMWGQLHSQVLLGVNWRVLLDRFCGIFIMMDPNKTMDEKVGNNNMTTYSKISFWIWLVVPNVNDYTSAQMTFSYIKNSVRKPCDEMQFSWLCHFLPIGEPIRKYLAIMAIFKTCELSCHC